MAIRPITTPNLVQGTVLFKSIPNTVTMLRRCLLSISIGFGRKTVRMCRPIEVMRKRPPIIKNKTR